MRPLKLHLQFWTSKTASSYIYIFQAKFTQPTKPSATSTSSSSDVESSSSSPFYTDAADPCQREYFAGGTFGHIFTNVSGPKVANMKNNSWFTSLISKRCDTSTSFLRGVLPSLVDRHGKACHSTIFVHVPNVLKTSQFCCFFYYSNIFPRKNYRRSCEISPLPLLHPPRCPRSHLTGLKLIQGDQTFPRSSEGLLSLSFNMGSSQVWP